MSWPLLCLLVTVGVWLLLGDCPGRLLLTPVVLVMLVGVVLRFAS